MHYSVQQQQHKSNYWHDCNFYASYATLCTSSACRAMEQPSHYPVPFPARYASRYPATSGWI